MANILITGIESFVGNVLKSRLPKKHKLYGIDIKPKLKNTFKIDLNSNKLNHFIKKKKIDFIIHLAATSRDNDCKKNVYNCYKNNVLGTLNILECAKANKVKKIIFASSEWIYDFNNTKKIKNENEFVFLKNSNTEYANSKIISENNLKYFFDENQRIDISILRFGIIYGNRLNNWSAVESLFMKVYRGENVEVGSLRTARQFIHVNDIADGIIKSINLKGFNIINLQGSKLITLKAIINNSMKITGNKIKVTEQSPNKPSIRKVSFTKAYKLINFQSKVTISNGLSKFYNYIKKEI